MVNRLCLLILVCSYVFPSLLFAATTPNAENMLVRVAETMPSLTRLVTAIAYVLGMYMVIKGILELKTYGEGRTMYSSDKSLRPALVFLVIGTLLIFLPSSVQVGLSTFWHDPCPYCYVDQGDRWSVFISSLFMVIQFIGVVAFIRGLVLFTQMAQSQGQGQTFGKALTHVIGGIFCINIYQFIQLVIVTLGIPYQFV